MRSSMIKRVTVEIEVEVLYAAFRTFSFNILF